MPLGMSAGALSIAKAQPGERKPGQAFKIFGYLFHYEYITVFMCNALKKSEKVCNVDL
jgi:hypothetical protein